MKPTGQGRGFLVGAGHELGISLGADQVERLLRFERLLRDRAIPLGLIAARDADDLLRRHVFDSLRAAPLIGDADRSVVDIGSGAGLPGAVVAVARPRAAVTLIEPRRRRAAFLELVTEELQLANASVVARRAEDVSVRADVALARAVAPLAASWRLARPLVRPGGRLFYFAGASVEVPRALVGADRIEVEEDLVIDSSGRLVIITRQ